LARTAHVDNDSILWFGTANGLVYARVSDLLRRDYPHIKLMIENVFSYETYDSYKLYEILKTGKIRLTRSSNSVSLTILPMLYGKSSDLRLRYRLDNDEWKDLEEGNTISLDHLFPGRYKLHIEAFGKPEICADYVVSVPLTWAAMLLLLLIALLIALVAHIAWCKVKHKDYVWERFLPKPEKYSKSKMDIKQAEQIARRLTELMETKQLYLKPDLQMSDLAKELNCSTHTLSQVFTQHIKRTYYDYIAELRVNEFIRRAKQPEYAKYTINALSEICGFRSRTPFLTAFKKFTGKTPKEFMKELKS